MGLLKSGRMEMATMAKIVKIHHNIHFVPCHWSGAQFIVVYNVLRRLREVMMNNWVGMVKNSNKMVSRQKVM